MMESFHAATRPSVLGSSFLHRYVLMPNMRAGMFQWWGILLWSGDSALVIAGLGEIRDDRWEGGWRVLAYGLEHDGYALSP